MNFSLILIFTRIFVFGFLKNYFFFSTPIPIVLVCLYVFFYGCSDEASSGFPPSIIDKIQRAGGLLQDLETRGFALK